MKIIVKLLAIIQVTSVTKTQMMSLKIKVGL